MPVTLRGECSEACEASVTTNGAPASARLPRTTLRLYGRSVTGKDLVRLLRQHGWTLEHIRGPHHILRKGGKTLSVPVHAGTDLGKGLLGRLLKEAGLK